MDLDRTVVKMEWGLGELFKLKISDYKCLSCVPMSMGSMNGGFGGGFSGGMGGGQMMPMPDNGFNGMNGGMGNNGGFENGSPYSPYNGKRK